MCVCVCVRVCVCVHVCACVCDVCVCENNRALFNTSALLLISSDMNQSVYAVHGFILH